MILNDGKYLKIKYFNKSKLLFGFIAGKPYWKNSKKLIETYLFASELDESILDYYLFAEFEKGVELDEKIIFYLYAKYETEDKTELYIFDLTHFKEDVDKFLVGNYSDISKKSKGDILKYNNYPIDKNSNLIGEIKDVKGKLHIYSILYPNRIKELVATELVEVHELFDTKAEALEVYKSVKELCESFDENKETYKKRLI